MSDRISVSSAALKLMEPNDNLIRDSVLYSTLKGESIGYNLVNDLLSSMAFTVDRFRIYAKDHYTLGLPTGALTTSVILDDTDVAAAIKDDLEYTEDVSIIFNTVSPLTSRIAILPFLSRERGLIVTDNSITIPPPGMIIPTVVPAGEDNVGAPVFLINIVISNIVLDPDNITVAITYQINTGVRLNNVPWDVDPIYKRTESFTENHTLNSAFSLGHTYCIAQYREQGSEIDKWWFYDTHTGIYPALDPIYNIDSEE